jgi:hypothetical protein
MATRDFIRQRSRIKTGVEPALCPAEDREATTDPGMETAVGVTDPAADGTPVASAGTSGTAGGPGGGPGQGGRPRPMLAPVQIHLTCSHSSPQ